jgi:hypothetical protein
MDPRIANRARKAAATALHPTTQDGDRVAASVGFTKMVAPEFDDLLTPKPDPEQERKNRELERRARLAEQQAQGLAAQYERMMAEREAQLRRQHGAYRGPFDSAPQPQPEPAQQTRYGWCTPLSLPTDMFPRLLGNTRGWKRSHLGGCTRRRPMASNSAAWRWTFLNRVRAMRSH